MTDAKRLATLLRARHPAVSIVTIDEAEALQAVDQCAEQIGCQVWAWNVLEGVRDRRARGADPVSDTDNPAAGLFWLAKQDLPALIVTCDLAPHLDDPRTLRALRDLIEKNRHTGSHIVMIDHDRTLPGVITGAVTDMELSLPGPEEIEAIVRATLKKLHREMPVEIDVTGRDYRLIIKNLAGLSARQIEQVILDVVAEDRKFDSADLNHILARKRQIMSAGGLLEYVESPATLDDIGGFNRLKQWLSEREDSFTGRASSVSLSPPRGVLMLGVQGAGKSLCAKAIATAWQRPLLRLDPGSLYDRYIGESERRLREALRQAEAMAPVVLWIDEIEKGFASAASQSTDGGLSQRMFGSLLTWMQDHDSAVFLVATANNIDALPPELLRKGRFDEIFFIDLPGTDARRKIFEIHLRRRAQDPTRFDLDALAEAAHGYSGAEIEQAIIATMHGAAAGRLKPGTEGLVESIRNSPPLSVTMAEKVAHLRTWAHGRCVPAD